MATMIEQWKFGSVRQRTCHLRSQHVGRTMLEIVVGMIVAVSVVAANRLHSIGAALLLVRRQGCLITSAELMVTTTPLVMRKFLAPIRPL